MAKVNIKQRLADAKKLYAKTEAKQGGEPLPPGTGYTGTIGSCTIEMSKKDRLQVVWPITVTGPAKFEGREHRDWSGLETENNIGFFKGRLEKIDVAVPDDIGDISDALDECEGLEIRFDVVKSEEFTNTYFRERVGEASEPADAEEPAEPEYTKKQLTRLGKEADKDDGDAIDELETAAKASNLDPDDYDTWLELAEGIIEDLAL